MIKDSAKKKIEEKNVSTADMLQEKGKKVADKLLNSDSLIYTFLRSIVASQAASWLDMILSFVLFAWVNLTPFLSTAIGAFSGGVLNCIINYRFTFHAAGVPWKAVAVKYGLVWVGSLLLNAYGTQVLYYLFSSWSWLEEIGFKPDGYFAAARLLASLIVSWAWNFILQRYFVYRNTRYDHHFIRVVNRFSIKNK